MKEYDGFDKRRFEYCEKLFEREVDRKGLIEGKAKFYITFISLFYGALFIKIESLESILKSIDRYQSVLKIVAHISILALMLFLLISMICILQSMRIQKWKFGYPRDVLSSLFSPEHQDSGFVPGNRPLEKYALEYLIAMEYNYKINNKKSKWIETAGIFIFLAAVSVFQFIGIIVYQSLVSQGG
jgi:hypothetical protein